MHPQKRCETLHLVLTDTAPLHRRRFNMHRIMRQSIALSRTLQKGTALALTTWRGNFRAPHVSKFSAPRLARNFPHPACLQIFRARAGAKISAPRVSPNFPRPGWREFFRTDWREKIQIGLFGMFFWWRELFVDGAKFSAPCVARNFPSCSKRL